MYHYEYAIRKVRKPIRDQIIELIKLVQKDLKNEFTFQYKFEGSDKFNLVTYDPRTNTGLTLMLIFIQTMKKKNIVQKN